MNTWTAEYQLLRRAARSCLGEAGDDAGGSRSHLRIDWEQVLWLGREEGALLILHEALRHDLRAVACPAEIDSQLDGLSAAAKLQGLARTAVICRLHDALSRAGIPFFVVDGWMFQTCFHPNQILIESVAPIQCLFASEDLPRARSILSEAGFPPSTPGVQIASFAQVPVECTAYQADTAPHGMVFPSEIGTDAIRLPGERFLRRLPNQEWLPLLAEPWRQRTTVPIFTAFQLSLLASRMSADRTASHPTWIEEAIAVSRATLDPATHGQVRRESRNIEHAATVLPACPFLPTPAPVIERMLTLAEVGPDDTVLDLGCGDGAIVVTAARRCGAQAVGIDCDPNLLASAKTRVESAGVSRLVSLVCGDLFTADLESATVICLYLAPAFYPALKPCILARARSGTRIVSHDYFFSGWPPVKTELVRVSAAHVSQIFVWRAP